MKGLSCVCTCQQMRARACVILELMDKAREVVPSHGEKSSDVSVFYVCRIAQDFCVSARILAYQVRLTYQPGI